MIPAVQVLLATAPVAGVTYATWNPADKSAALILSNGDLTLSAIGNSSTTKARSTIGKSSGKWYWEYKMTGIPGPIAGIATAAAPLNTYPGQDTTSFGYYTDGQKYTAGGGSAYGAAYTASDVIGVALDMDAKTVTFYKNGVSQGVAFSGLSGTVYAAGGNSGAPNISITANFGATAFAFAVPSGFNAGLYL